MAHNKVIDEIFDELIDKIFPNIEVSQYYGKFVEVDEETFNKFNSIPLVNLIRTEDLKKILERSKNNESN